MRTTFRFVPAVVIACTSQRAADHPRSRRRQRSGTGTHTLPIATRPRHATHDERARRRRFRHRFLRPRLARQRDGLDRHGDDHQRERSLVFTIMPVTRGAEPRRATTRSTSSTSRAAPTPSTACGSTARTSIRSPPTARREHRHDDAAHRDLGSRGRGGVRHASRRHCRLDSADPPTPARSRSPADRSRRTSRRRGRRRCTSCAPTA